MVGVTARLASGVRKRMAIQVLGTRAVGEGAARASGACGLNTLVPIKRRFAHLSPSARCLLIDLTPPLLIHRRYFDTAVG